MNNTETASRARTIEKTICSRLGISEDDYMMLFFESGCRLIESYLKLKSYTDEEYKTAYGYYMKSKLFWGSWWPNRFLLVCELFVKANYRKTELLDYYLRKVTPPNGEVLNMLTREFIMMGMEEI